MKNKNPRLQTFQESGITIKPYTSLPTIKGVKCKEHEYEQKEDGFGHIYHQCKRCYSLK